MKLFTIYSFRSYCNHYTYLTEDQYMMTDYSPTRVITLASFFIYPSHSPISYSVSLLSFFFSFKFHNLYNMEGKFHPAITLINIRNFIPFTLEMESGWVGNILPEQSFLKSMSCLFNNWSHTTEINTTSSYFLFFLW